MSELLSAELMRVGKRLPIGPPGTVVEPSLPGPKVQRLDQMSNPSAITPLAQALRAASKFAIETLRNRAFVPPIVPQPPEQQIAVLGMAAPEHTKPAAAAPAARPSTTAAPAAPAPRPAPQPTFIAGTEDTKRMQELNVRLASLANDVSPAGDKAYQACLQDIRRHEDAMRAKLAVA